MSLNGLDDPRVAEAHQAALAEAGGWFLLKYISRDGVELHARGSGGVPEARAAIAEYEDKSPLYGFLIYRRRKVLVKYIPEGTSRLVQARVTVHFQSFEERFKQNDTVIIIAASSELTDIALSAACQLHSAAETTRSSGGSSAQLRRSKLDEIVEDPKERPSYDARAASIEKPSAPLPPEPTIPETEKELPSLPTEHDRPSTRGSHRSHQPPVASRKAAAILGIPVSDVSSVNFETSSLRPTSPVAAGDTASLYAASLGSGPADLRADYLAYLDALDERSSTSTARPSLSELYAGLYQKPKVRLGPRPSADGAARAAVGPRPVSSLPQGLRAAPRKELHSANRPAQKQAALDPIIRLPPPPPIPEVPLVPEIIRPGSSAASIRSMPTTLASQASKRTPEKKRLQKAMEMRKKQLAAAKSREGEAVLQPEAAVPSRRPEAETTSKHDAEPALPAGPPQLSIPMVGGKAEQMDATEQSFFDDTDLATPTSPPKEPAPSSLRNVSSPTDKPYPEAPSETAGRDEHIPEVTTEPVQEAPSTPSAPAPSQPRLTNGDTTEPLGTADTEHTFLPSAPEAKKNESSEQTSPQRLNRNALSALDDLLALDTLQPSTPPRDTSHTEALSKEIAEPATQGGDLTETDAARSPARAYPDHLKSDSGVQIEVKDDSSRPGTGSQEQRHEPSREGGPPDGSSQLPADVQDTSDPPSTKSVSKPHGVEDRLVEQPSDANNKTTAIEDRIEAPVETELPTTQPDATPKTPTTPNDTKRRRRQGMISPTALQPSTPVIEDSEFDVSDDEFINELEDAQVQEAKPIAVTKNRSPVDPRLTKTSVTGSPGSPSTSPLSQRRPSQPLLKPKGQASPIVSRSASAAQLSKMPGAEGSITVAKSVNVSSGISQRIKALARNSSSSDQLSLDRVPSRESTGKTISALRKSSLGSGATRPFAETPPALPYNARERVVSMARDASSPEGASYRSPQMSTTTSPKDSIHAVYNVSQQSGRPESISVTARIVRDDRTQKPSLTAPSEVVPLELHESPLVIEHHRRTTPVSVAPRLQPVAIENSPEPAEPMSPTSPTRARSLRSLNITSQPRSSTENWRSSFSLGRKRRSSESKATTSMLKSASSTSLGTTGSRDPETASEKRRDSVSSRMLKRMSNSISLGRKTITQIVGPTLEEPSGPFPERVPEDRRPGTAYAAEIGDLNVQLPDTLLWKRRWVEIDEYGNFVVKMSKSNEMANTRNNTKAFHLSELKKPLLPDHERQEMPNSVVLDFVDGRTMQCACETVGGQREVLRLLQEAHSAYTH